MFSFVCAIGLHASLMLGSDLDQAAPLPHTDSDGLRFTRRTHAHDLPWRNAVA
jgi:hypothetical protein